MHLVVCLLVASSRSWDVEGEDSSSPRWIFQDYSDELIFLLLVVAAPAAAAAAVVLVVVVAMAVLIVPFLVRSIVMLDEKSDEMLFWYVFVILILVERFVHRFPSHGHTSMLPIQSVQ